jgi:hypothetical protein
MRRNAVLLSFVVATVYNNYTLSKIRSNWADVINANAWLATRMRETDAMRHLASPDFCPAARTPRQNATLNCKAQAYDAIVFFIRLPSG